MERKKTPLRGRRLGRDAWVRVARETLIESGIESVKIGSLARKLRATRASFYYHFADRAALLRELLKYWEANNTRPFVDAIGNGNADGVTKFNRIINIWLEETSYVPAFDSAVRDWARNSGRVARVVKRIDLKRIDILKAIYVELGHPQDIALIRARVAYFHQVGYYTLGLGETMKQRRRARPLYLEVLLGR